MFGRDWVAVPSWWTREETFFLAAFSLSLGCEVIASFDMDSCAASSYVQHVLSNPFMRHHMSALSFIGRVMMH